MKITGRFLNRGDIPAAEIQQAYLKAFKVSWWQRLFFGQGDIKLADQTYKQVGLTKLKEILEKDKTDKQEWVSEFYDCDDHAFSLMGAFHHDRDTAAMPIFITWVSTPQGGHAVLSFYHNGEISIIEPQNDEIFPIPEGWSLILVCG